MQQEDKEVEIRKIVQDGRSSGTGSCIIRGS